MTDNIEQHEQDQAPPQTSSTAAEIMAETEAQPLQSVQQNEATKKPLGNISFSIWPPTQRTREAVVTRLIETLTSPSVLSKRYGTVPLEEAEGLAKRIEEEAFAAAGSGPSGVDIEGDGIEILQVYSKEISKRMLDTVKSRSGSPATTVASTPATPPPASVVEEKKESEVPVAEDGPAGDGGDKNEE